MLAHQVCGAVKVAVVDTFKNFAVPHVDIFYVDRLIIHTGKNFNLRTQLLCSIVEIVVLRVAVKGNMKFFRIILPLCNLVFCKKGIAFFNNLLQLKDQRRFRKSVLAELNRKGVQFSDHLENLTDIAFGEFLYGDAAVRVVGHKSIFRETGQSFTNRRVTDIESFF